MVDITGPQTNAYFIEGKVIDLSSLADGHTLIYELASDSWTTGAGGGGVGNHAILDGSVHTDSVAQGVTRGSIIYGNATPKWDELVIGTAGKFLKSDGTDISWETPNYTTNTNNMILSGWHVTGITIGGTRYKAYASAGAYRSTESEASEIIPVNCTFKNLYARFTRQNTLDGASVFTVMKNGVATALTLSIASGSTATTSNTNDVSFSAGDLCSVRMDGTASTGGTGDQISFSSLIEV